MACYDFKKFLKACRRKRNIIVPQKSIENGRRDFQLNTQDQILNFIGNKSWEDIEEESSGEWLNNPNPEIEIIVDAYVFWSGKKIGYLAFFQSPFTSEWVIKSFHESDFE